MFEQMSDTAAAPISSTKVREWTAPALQAVEDFARRSVDEWLAMCGQFLDWHRANRLLREAPPEVGREGDRVHAWLLRSARMLSTQMRDPDFPHPELARLVETELWQLEEAWAQTHNPLTEAEGDRLIAQHFPADAPGT